MKCHYIVTVFLLEKPIQLFSIFLWYDIKIVFLINLEDGKIYVG